MFVMFGPALISLHSDSQELSGSAIPCGSRNSPKVHSPAWRIKSEYDTLCAVDEGRKRVLAIVAGILVARHLKTTEDLFDSKPSPRTESLVASAVQWAEKIMRKIDGVYR
jgi:hypothetical protein